ncbi:hypothetical protein ACPCG0_04275 [Propionibacteriaceae bacterium Y1923]
MSKPIPASHYGVYDHGAHVFAWQPNAKQPVLWMSAASLFADGEPLRGGVPVIFAGSNTLTHINDASFWLFKGYFDLSVKDTLKTWGMLALSCSIIGLVTVLALSLVF